MNKKLISIIQIIPFYMHLIAGLSGLLGIGIGIISPIITTKIGILFTAFCFFIAIYLIFYILAAIVILPEIIDYGVRKVYKLLEKINS